MKPSRTDTEEIPDELYEALSEASFSQITDHSRWTYATVFVRNKADNLARALTAEEVEANYKKLTTLDPSESTTYIALNELVEAGILECDRSREPYKYWLSHSLKTTGNETTTDATSSESGSASRVSNDSQTPESNSPSESQLRYFGFERIWLFALVIGLSLTLLTLVLLRLSVPTSLSIGSAALAWGAISIGLVVFLASFHQAVK